MSGDRPSRHGGSTLLLFGAALALYVLTAAPGLLWGDSADFQASAARADLALGVRTYPLYDLLTYGAGRALPFGTLAYRVTLVSAVFGAAAVAVTFAALLSMRFSRLAALGASAALAVSHGLWSQSVVAEVYSLHAFFVAAVLALAAGAGPFTRRRVLLLGAVLGLGLLHHRTTAFLFPPVLLVLLRRRRELLRDRALRLATAAGAALALAPAAPILLFGGGAASLPASPLD
ncbi:MAG: DUF2723 domain-containing protein, partial [Candidatus Latescibacteria bacterium]|nr:DUF2723 domain-containing protein [Candidatus Latescibacterota bacterium]